MFKKKKKVSLEVLNMLAPEEKNNMSIEKKIDIYEEIRDLFVSKVKFNNYETLSYIQQKVLQNFGINGIYPMQYI